MRYFIASPHPFLCSAWIGTINYLAGDTGLPLRSNSQLGRRQPKCRLSLSLLGPLQHVSIPKGFFPWLFLHATRRPVLAHSPTLRPCAPRRAANERVWSPSWAESGYDGGGPAERSAGYWICLQGMHKDDPESCVQLRGYWKRLVVPLDVRTIGRHASMQKSNSTRGRAEVHEVGLVPHRFAGGNASMQSRTKETATRRSKRSCDLRNRFSFGGRFA